jgi:VWFA-related protein
VLLFLVAALLWIGVATAQSSETPLLRVNVREVLVPVIVTDRKGHHVTGLKTSDFRIQEDGVGQDITTFSTDTAPAAAALISALEVGATNGVPARPGAAESLRQTFVICIDTLHSTFGNSARTREAGCSRRRSLPELSTVW